MSRSPAELLADAVWHGMCSSTRDIGTYTIGRFPDLKSEHIAEIQRAVNFPIKVGSRRRRRVPQTAAWAKLAWPSK